MNGSGKQVAAEMVNNASHTERDVENSSKPHSCSSNSAVQSIVGQVLAIIWPFSTEIGLTNNFTAAQMQKEKNKMSLMLMDAYYHKLTKCYIFPFPILPHFTKSLSSSKFVNKIYLFS